MTRLIDAGEPLRDRTSSPGAPAWLWMQGRSVVLGFLENGWCSSSAEARM